MKTLCIYHRIDLDGWMSAAIVKKAHKLAVLERSEIRRTDMSKTHTMEFLGYNYGDPNPSIVGYDMVIICDVSFPLVVFQKLWQGECHNIVWIDHHESAIKESGEYVDKFGIKGIRDTKFAACELTWKYFFPKETMPFIVELLGLYDSFRHKGTDQEKAVLEFQYGARQAITNYEEAYTWLSNPNENALNTIQSMGEGIYAFLCTDAKQIYKNGFEMVFDPEPEYRTGKTYRFIAINKERFNPINFGLDYHKDGYDGAACFHFANEFWNFSLYNDNGMVDVSLIAKQFGGGGHKGASGFRIKDINQLIVNK